MAVSETGHTHASGAIDVLLPLLIPQARPRTAHDGDTPLGVHPAGVALFEFLYSRHVRSFLPLRGQRGLSLTRPLPLLYDRPLSLQRPLDGLLDARITQDHR